jgi:murein DD-endopeptidase MepM/ murein hydrolase activator NlpD
MFTACSARLYAQPTVKVYSEQTESGYIIYGDNPEFCPVTIQLNLKLTNMLAEGSSEQVHLLPTQSYRQKLCTIRKDEPGKAFSYSLKYKSNFGDHKLNNYDSVAIYHLPYKSAQGYLLHQGYNGSFSHQNQYALDFTMAEGTPILAARAGIVVKVVDDNKKSCATGECVKYNNYILVYHSDGTFAEYTHIRKKGALVMPGDEVVQGQHIAYSGNVGWSTGPHLHFVVFQQNMDSRKSLPTKFKLDNTDEPAYLEEKKTYSRNY